MDNTITCDKNYVELIKNAIHCSQHKMIRSRESFINIINSILSFGNETTQSYDPMINFVFAYCCSAFPKIAIFMVKNNMCTKESFFGYYEGSSLFKNIFLWRHDALINCFIENVEFLGEILVHSDKCKSLPLFYLHDSVSNIQMLKSILNSKHCTTETLGTVCESNNRNVLQHWISNGWDRFVKILLESEKCTTDFVVGSYSNNNRYGFVYYNNCMFKLILDSDKLPLDYFDENIFNVVNFNGINMFLDSQYSNEEIIKKYFSNIKIKKDNVCKILLSHAKFSHLAEKYNTDGTFKPVSLYEQKNVKIVMTDEVDIDTKTCVGELTNTVQQLRLENNTLQLQVELTEIENKILQLQITRFELEKQMVPLEK